MKTQLNVGTRIQFDNDYMGHRTIMKIEYGKKGLPLYIFQEGSEMFSFTNNEIHNNTKNRSKPLIKQHLQDLTL